MSFVFKYRQLSECLYYALKDDPYYITMERTVEKAGGFEAMVRYMEFSMTEAEKYGELYIPKEHEYGVSVWAKPVSHDEREKKAREKYSFLNEYMGETSLKTYKDISGFMSAKAGEIVTDDYWYLSILGVMPEYQGRGLGVELVVNILAETDRMKIPTYLETFTPRNMSFYRRLGYEDSGFFREPVTGAEYFVMTRQPV